MANCISYCNTPAIIIQYSVVVPCFISGNGGKINGFWIHFKRLEKGRIVWPDAKDDIPTMQLAYEDLKSLILSPGITQKIRRNEAWKR